MVRRLVEKLASKGDEVVSQVAGEFMLSSAFATAVEQVIRTKGFVDRQVRAALKSMNVASLADVEEAGDRVRRLQRDLRRLEVRIERLEQPAGEAPPAGAGQRGRRRVPRPTAP